MDYNEDRQVTFQNPFDEEQDFSLASKIAESDQDMNAFIYLDTIGT